MRLNFYIYNLLKAVSLGQKRTLDNHDVMEITVALINSKTPSEKNE